MPAIQPLKTNRDFDCSIMSDLKCKFSEEVKTVFFEPTTKIVYREDKDAPKLKRRASRRPPLYRALPEPKPQQFKPDDPDE